MFDPVALLVKCRELNWAVYERIARGEAKRRKGTVHFRQRRPQRSRYKPTGRPRKPRSLGEKYSLTPDQEAAYRALRRCKSWMKPTEILQAIGAR